jgi:hypothetical protein
MIVSSYLWKGILKLRMNLGPGGYNIIALGRIGVHTPPLSSSSSSSPSSSSASSSPSSPSSVLFCFLFLIICERLLIWSFCFVLSSAHPPFNPYKGGCFHYFSGACPSALANELLFWAWWKTFSRVMPLPFSVLVF